MRLKNHPCLSRRSRRTSTLRNRRRATPRRAWSRPWRNTASAALHLRGHPVDPDQPQVRGDRQADILPDRAWQGGVQFPDRALFALRRLRIHGATGGFSGPGGAGRNRVDPGRRQFLEAVPPAGGREEQDRVRQKAQMMRELGTDPESGKPVRVRVGRYGAFVQVGDREDEEKPGSRAFAKTRASRPSHSRKRWICWYCRDRWG